MIAAGLGVLWEGGQPLLLILESPKLEKGDLWSHNYKALTV